MTARSPNNCVSSLIYGVSPQPAHAPLNSKSGCWICCCRSVVVLSLRRSNSGRVRKKFQLSCSAARSGACGRMLMALSLTSVLFLAGQTSTQSAQPVQSSAATCSENFKPLNSGTRASVTLNVGGGDAPVAEGRGDAPVAEGNGDAPSPVAGPRDEGVAATLCDEASQLR